MNNQDKDFRFSVLQFYEDYGSNMSEIDAKWFMRKRYFVTILMFLGWLIAFLLRTNLSVAVVEMTSNKTIVRANETYLEESEFHWNSLEKGVIISSFSWGYACSVFSGMWINKFRGTVILGYGLLITAVITMLTPFLIKLNIYLYLLFRVVEGIAESFAAASVVDIVFYWAPREERARIINIANSGSYASPAITYPLCGSIAKWYGWEAVFYFSGGLSLLWCLIWFTCVGTDPAHDRCISFNEKCYLARKIEPKKFNKVPFSWRKMFGSPAVWAFVNDKFVEAWLMSFLYYCIPLYVKDMQNRDINEIGFLSAVPHVTSIFGTVSFSYLADHFRTSKIMTITNIHRLFIAFSQISCIVLLIIMAVWMEFTMAITCLSMIRLCYCAAITCYGLLPMDMGQQYCGYINGFATSAIAIGYLLNPIILGLMTPNHTSSEWGMYFAFLCIFNVWGSVIFFYFGSGEPVFWQNEQCNVENSIPEDAGQSNCHRNSSAKYDAAKK